MHKTWNELMAEDFTGYPVADHLIPKLKRLRREARQWRRNKLLSNTKSEAFVARAQHKIAEILMDDATLRLVESGGPIFVAQGELSPDTVFEIAMPKWLCLEDGVATQRTAEQLLARCIIDRATHIVESYLTDNDDTLLYYLLFTLQERIQASTELQFKGACKIPAAGTISALQAQA